LKKFTDPIVLTKNKVQDSAELEEQKSDEVNDTCDTGTLGMISFFHTHKCNAYCKKIGLTSIDLVNQLTDQQKQYI
jgi:hypothetical protein